MAESKNKTIMIHFWVGGVEIESNETEEGERNNQKFTPRVLEKKEEHMWLVVGWWVVVYI